MEVTCQIWDMEELDTEKEKSQFYRGSSGIILIYDISNRESFENLGNWFKLIHTNLKDMSLKKIAVVGNKADREKKILEDDVIELIDRWNGKFECDIDTYRISCEDEVKGDIEPNKLFYDFIKSITKSIIELDEDKSIDNILVKINLVGDLGVGKTTFKNTVIGERFEYRDPTFIDFTSKSIEFSQNELRE